MIVPKSGTVGMNTKKQGIHLMSEEQIKYNTKWWEDRFKSEVGWKAHESQNHLISRDFIRCIKNMKIEKELQTAKSIVEMGCGTGELIAYLHQMFHYDHALGFDYCASAIKKAQELHPLPNLTYIQHDAKQGLNTSFDLSISSNTLEHFKDPHKIMHLMLKYSKKAIIIVPWKQGGLDPWKGEGGPLHVIAFDKESFMGQYKLEEFFTFTTAGWNGSPGQAVALISETE